MALVENVRQVPKVGSDYKLVAMSGYIVIVLTFGILGGWAATAPLDAGVVSPGVLVAETNRKTLQHLEGGIVREILVRDGQTVQEGEVLFRLDDVAARAGADTIRVQLDAARVQEARLIAERDQAAEITLPPGLRLSSNPMLQQAVADQIRQFQERKASLDGQIAILESRVSHYEREIAGLEVELTSLRSQVELINRELVDMRHLLERNLIQRPRVYAHDRERARLEGLIGRNEAETAKARNAITEAQLQVRQLRQRFQEEVATQILEVRQRVSELSERFRVAAFVLERTLVRSPQTGIVQGLRFFTPGAVVRPAEAMLDIVPLGDDLIIHANVAPTEVDKVHPGLTAEVRFPSFAAATTPIINGRVRSVSRDRLIDEATRQPYFLAHVVVDTSAVPAELRARLQPGLPAEVIVATGERTFLSYLVRPMTDRIRRSFREQ